VQLARNIAGFPQTVCLQRILPALVQQVELGNSADGSQRVVDKWKVMTLAPLAQISPHVSPQQFKEQVEPIILRFFASKNRMTRVMVLQNCGGFIGQLNADLVNTKIYPDVESGFADTNTTMREETIKAMVSLAPVLNAANLGRVLQQFNRLMLTTKDQPDCAFLRENCVICAQHIAAYIHAAGLQMQLLKLCWIPVSSSLDTFDLRAQNILFNSDFFNALGIVGRRH